MDDFNVEADKNAEAVLGKLLSGGDFSALASEYNLIEELKNNNGDLGWVTETDNPSAVAQVRNWEVGEFSQAKMSATEQELSEERDAVQHLLP